MSNKLKEFIAKPKVVLVIIIIVAVVGLSLAIPAIISQTETKNITVEGEVTTFDSVLPLSSAEGGGFQYSFHLETESGENYRVVLDVHDVGITITVGMNIRVTGELVENNPLTIRAISNQYVIL